MKSLANYISIVRILLVFTLFLTEPLSIEFFVIYVVCGLSDIFDGYIARKTQTSKLGEKLDSAADLIMLAVLFIILYRFLNLPVQIFAWIIIIVIIRGASIITVFIKYKTFAILHTFGNKVTGFILFLFPLMLKIFNSNTPMYVLCVIASISAIEEFLIHLLSDVLQVNRKSIFSKIK